ncbi:MAG: malonic semialdehyde reductase [Maricaulaceae bacterium]|nr:malonic semialdehyde reductase [Maricaulaceae bacterium]
MSAAPALKPAFAESRHTSLDAAALDQLFRKARTHYAWLDRPVPEALIRELYGMLALGPTSMNNSPARFAFIGSPEGKARLKPHLAPGNVDKTMAAPWTAIIAWDREFYEQMPKLFPPVPKARDIFAAPEAASEHGFRNGTLQGAYLILAARALGLDAGPMSGFDRAGIDREFFAGHPQRKNWTANFLVNLGYGSETSPPPRLQRLTFDEAAAIL